jgi:hypothetical protein
METLYWADLMDVFPGRLFSEIRAEINRLPIGFLEEVLEARAYRQAKQMTDAADTPDARKRLPKGGFFQLVPEIEAELVEEELGGGNGRV